VDLNLLELFIFCSVQHVGSIRTLDVFGVELRGMLSPYSIDLTSERVPVADVYATDRATLERKHTQQYG
jgi:hypothetical protein